jgi:hypothetical protein
MEMRFRRYQSLAAFSVLRWICLLRKERTPLATAVPVIDAAAYKASASPGDIAIGC